MYHFTEQIDLNFFEINFGCKGSRGYDVSLVGRRKQFHVLTGYLESLMVCATKSTSQFTRITR